MSPSNTNNKQSGSSFFDKVKNVDDKALLLSILRDSSDEEGKECIRLMTPEQARKAVKDIHDAVMTKASDATKRQAAAASLATKAMGLTSEPYMLQLIVEGNDGLRTQIAASMKMSWVGDDALKKKYREAKKKIKKEDIQNPTPNCHGCGTPTPIKHLKMCSSCRSVSYCSRECQVKDWKKDGGHKKECKSLKNRLVSKTQPPKPKPKPNAAEAATAAAAAAGETSAAVDIPWICLAVPPSITGFDKDVKLHLPAWDFDDEKYIGHIRRDMKTKMISILQNVKMFFKLERANGQTDEQTVGDMCVDVFMLHVLGYKDTDGKEVIRVLPMDEVQNGKNFAETYCHYTKVPKGWCIPPEDRPFIPPDVLAALDEGIESVRKTMGERDAL